ncbi:unnamed protein product [Protopolystoma xenopodis]|uniref:Uncharacterized protein n=1 Tax=Protopolystoma xenopodis TaxID=117903 RepID=A0A3S5CN28_9PLAT|nr:unnamed protein product [Protopolystoma xenopodis]
MYSKTSCPKSSSLFPCTVQAAEVTGYAHSFRRFSKYVVTGKPSRETTCRFVHYSP